MGGGLACWGGGRRGWLAGGPAEPAASCAAAGGPVARARNLGITSGSTASALITMVASSSLPYATRPVLRAGVVEAAGRRR